MHLSPAAAYLLDTLHENGYGAWLVGGCVRDSLRGVCPHDFDIATTALPKQVMSCFPDFQLLPTGIRHGTVTVVADGGLLEVTTLRSEGSYRDGRRPDAVTFVTDIKADLARRDFTVNAMAWNSMDGLVDPFGGQDDLARGLLRCVGDPVERLQEDSLRIMRCLRFAACFGFSIHEETALALHSQKEGLQRVAVERIWHELSMLLCGAFAGEIIRGYLDILKVIIPDIIPNVDEKLLAATPSDSGVRLALLLDGTPPETALRRLRLDNDTLRKTTALCALLARPLPCTRVEAAKLTLQAGPERMLELMGIWRAQALTAQPEEAEHLSAALIYGEQVLSSGCYSVNGLAIDGNTLIDLGMSPGPGFGKLLGSLALAVMDGSCENEVRALTALARRLYRGEKV